jgi:hypothetical protein
MFILHCLASDGHPFDFKNSFMVRHRLGMLPNMAGGNQEELALLQSS